ncbi:MAG: hypothetical protein AB8H80_02595 [Planctomycetota bacterium]
MSKVVMAAVSSLVLSGLAACGQQPSGQGEPSQGAQGDGKQGDGKQGGGKQGDGKPIDWTATPVDGPTAVPSDFVRFVKVGEGGHFDTAITTYEKDGVAVVFYAAVHIADSAVFEELNDRFTTCDRLLYELVGPEDYRPTKGGRRGGGGSPISMLQTGMKRGLELSFQLDEIDYQVDNFVHADMTPEEFEESMEERGESLMSIMFNMMIDGAKQQRANDDGGEGEPGPKLDLVQAFRTGHGRHLLRMTFASQLEQMEMMAAGGDGSTLLEGRNEKCLQVLQRELKGDHKRLGIYYGAAHLPHLEQRLVQDLGFRKTGHEWLVAWDCKKRPDPKLDRVKIKKIRTAKKQMKALLVCVEDWRRLNGDTLPANIGTLLSLEEAGKKPSDLPSQDPWGNDYRIEKRRFGSRWQLVSVGPDGEFATDDDIVVAEPRR